MKARVFERVEARRNLLSSVIPVLVTGTHLSKQLPFAVRGASHEALLSGSREAQHARELQRIK